MTNPDDRQHAGDTTGERSEAVPSKIIVGVDGSEGSRAALAWAVDEAGRREAVVTAVSAWEHSMVHAGSITREPPHDAASIARGLLEDETRELVAAGVPITQEVVEGKAAKVLVEQSAEAALLVVGATGRGALADRVLGSVTLRCVSHAHCTVVVVRR